MRARRSDLRAAFSASSSATRATSFCSRVVGFGGLLYANIHNDGIWSDLFNYESFDDADSKADYFIAVTSLSLVIGSYLFDWIHGRSKLEKKQQAIRFKYSLKMMSEKNHTHTFTSESYPAMAISIHF